MKTLPVVILAGGLGTRLLPATKMTPKVMIPILGKPFLAWKLEELVSQGVTEVYILLGVHADQVIEFLSSYKIDLKILVFRDGDALMGTAGAIRKNLNSLPKDFILTYGDNLLDYNLEELSHAHSQEKKAIMVCTTYREETDNFNVQVIGKFVSKYDKSDASNCNFMDYGYSVFQAKYFANLDLAKSTDLELIIQDLILQKELIALATNLEYYEIGTPAGLKKTTIRLTGISE